MKHLTQELHFRSLGKRRQKKIIKAFQLKAYQLLIVLVPIISLQWGRASERGEGGKESVSASVSVSVCVRVSVRWG